MPNLHETRNSHVVLFSVQSKLRGCFWGSVNVGREALETTTSNNSGFINQSSIVCQKICGKPMEKPMVSYRW